MEHPNKLISLDGAWRLYVIEPGQMHFYHPDSLLASGLGWIPAQVPGNVELDLMQAGRLEDPFAAGRMQILRPLERNAWWYVKDFELPEQPAGKAWDLIFHGLDTYAEVWLNGARLGSTANAFIEHRFSATDALKPGSINRLSVHIASAFEAARRYEYDAAAMSWETREEALYIRKPAHAWGWDILPRAVSAGIWRGAQLVERAEDEIEQLYFWTASIMDDAATLGVRFQFRTGRADLRGMHLHFSATCGEHSFEADWPVEFTAGGGVITVSAPRLWWPKGYGDAALYSVVTRLMQAEEVLAERTDRIGLRQISLERTETAEPNPTGVLSKLAESGETRVDVAPIADHHFLFNVNGVPILVKGANWSALDALHSRDAGRYAQALELAHDLGVNMLRCWGGSVYEDHAFFDFCDENGIMVWQDFAFACCRYPQTDIFLNEVQREAEAAVKKLRNHASLAVWCGDNEVDMAYAFSDLNPKLNRLTRETLPRVVHRLDPYRAFVPSSPYISEAAFEGWPKALDTPEQHLWGPRNYYKSDFYTRHSAHFIGEIGYHGCPNVSSLRRFLSPEHLWPWQGNEEWQVHSTYHWQHKAFGRDRIALMANQVRELFGEIPEDLETFALASQITQAEAKKYFIESTRLRKWITSGILWWNLIDGWPQFSDAVVDYYFAPKLAYHFIRRVQQAVCVIAAETGAGQPAAVVVCNDSREDAHVRLRVWDADNRQTLLEGELDVPANQNHLAGRIQMPDGERGLWLIEFESGGQRGGNHLLLGPPAQDLARYRAWLAQIAALERPFELDKVAA